MSPYVLWPFRPNRLRLLADAYVFLKLFRHFNLSPGAGVTPAGWKIPRGRLRTTWADRLRKDTRKPVSTLWSRRLRIASFGRGTRLRSNLFGMRKIMVIYASSTQWISLICLILIFDSAFIPFALQHISQEIESVTTIRILHCSIIHNYMHCSIIFTWEIFCAANAAFMHS